MHSATTAFIAGLVPPYGASGSRVARSATSSSAQNAPVPRTSPTHSCCARELGQAGAEDLVAERGGVLDDAVVLHRADGGDGGGAGQRVAGVGQAAGVDAVVEGRGDLGR